MGLLAGMQFSLNNIYFWTNTFNLRHLPTSSNLPNFHNFVSKFLFRISFCWKIPKLGYYFFKGIVNQFTWENGQINCTKYFLEYSDLVLFQKKRIEGWIIHMVKVCGSCVAKSKVPHLVTVFSLHYTHPGNQVDYSLYRISIIDA